MTSSVICIAPTISIGEAMAVMTEKRVRHLPVHENDKIIGIVSIGDVVRAVISQQEFEIDQLAKYIMTG